MARTVEDLALLYHIIAGPDGRDTEVPPVPVDEVPELALKHLRVAFAPTFPGFPVAADIRDAGEELVQHLNRAGVMVAETRLPELDFDQEILSAGALIGMAIGAFQRKKHAPPITLAQYLEALHRRDRSMFAWEQFFQAWDALLCPASMVTAFPHCATGSPRQVDGEEVEYGMGSAHSTVFNYTGHPAVVLPYTRNRDGLPIGVQVVGRRWVEPRLLAIAKALSQVTGEFRRPAGY
jgi:amidase